MTAAERRGSVWVLGAGAFSARRLPIGLERLCNAAKIYTIIQDPVGLWLPAELLSVDVIRLTNLLTNVGDRLENYRRIANTVVRDVREGSCVVYIARGSPVVFDRIVGIIRELCIEANLELHVVPSTSSVDALLAFVGRDMAPGLQICEARWLVHNRISIEPKLPVILFQPSVFWSDGIPSADEISVARLAPLKRYLSSFYPKTHPVMFVRAPLDFFDKGYIRHATMDCLDLGSTEDLHDTSLFIPPLEDAQCQHAEPGEVQSLKKASF